MEQKVEDIIYQINHKEDKTDEWYINVCEEISNILGSDCPEYLKKKLIQNSDYVFMMRDCIIETSENE